MNRNKNNVKLVMKIRKRFAREKNYNNFKTFNKIELRQK